MTTPPDPLAPAADALLAAYQSVGLWPELDPASFLALVRERGQDSTLEELWVETAHDQTALRMSRQFLLCRLRGVNQDVGFAAEEVLFQVQLLIPEIEWGDEQYGPTRDIGGIQVGERRIDLALGSSKVSWRYASVAGLVDGLDALLREAGRDERFIGLRTDGDYYCYVLGDAAIEEAMSRSALFELYREPDPLAGPG